MYFCTNDRELHEFEKLMMEKSSRYLAAVFLLSSDSDLWEMVEDEIRENGIRFDRMKARHLSFDQYVLYHAAKDVYLKTQFVSFKDLSDPSLISDFFTNNIEHVFGFPMKVYYYISYEQYI